MAENEGKRDPIIRILYDVMNAGGWYTLPELREALRRRGRVALDTGLSARLRDLRKSPWNRSLWVRPRKGSSHLHEYALMSQQTLTGEVRHG
jgi:hypothetical protein